MKVSANNGEDFIERNRSTRRSIKVAKGHRNGVRSIKVAVFCYFNHNMTRTTGIKLPDSRYPITSRGEFFDDNHDSQMFLITLG